MFGFEKDIIDTKAKYHVFIGTESGRTTKEAFQVCKYSLYSLASEDISIISIPYNHFLLIPSLCKEYKLKGKALFINETFFFRDDVIKLFKETEKEEALVWATKYKDRSLWSSLMIFNLSAKKLLELLPKDKVLSWSVWHTYNFKWLASRDLVIDFEVRPLPLDWNVITGVTEIEAPKHTVKAINFTSVGGPWKLSTCKYSTEWFKEYHLFLINEIVPYLLTNNTR